MWFYKIQAFKTLHRCSACERPLKSTTKSLYFDVENVMKINLGEDSWSECLPSFLPVYRKHISKAIYEASNYFNVLAQKVCMEESLLRGISCCHFSASAIGLANSYVCMQNLIVKTPQLKLLEQLINFVLLKHPEKCNLQK